jgi:hypothetical protein
LPDHDAWSGLGENPAFQLIAPKSVREAARRLFVEAARTRAVARFREELITAIRLDLVPTQIPEKRRRYWLQAVL